MKGLNTDELADFLEFTRDQELDVRFIEWMPFDDNRWKDANFFSYQVHRIENYVTVPAPRTQTCACKRNDSASACSS